MCLTRKRRNWYLPQTFHQVSSIVVTIVIEVSEVKVGKKEGP